MLPNESLLQVLLFADYKTIVFAKLVGAHFQRLATKFAEDLAGRHTCEVTFFSDYVTCYDVTIDAERRIWYKPVNPASLAAACRELAGVIGPHGVDRLSFFQDPWNMPIVGVIFEAAPPLKYAKDAEVSTTMAPRRRLSPVQLLRCCTTLPRLRAGETLKLDFSDNFFSGALGLRIIELLKGSGCGLIFRMTLPDGDNLTLDESDYTVDIDGTAVRYTSEKSGIVVDVKGACITIQSTPTKQRCDTDERR
ncbi:hypothetical protein AAVH_24640 [Aphelenchoides avenae]|nr:hypothetical protein AAVH_24640 [Aphelenchus avenae]